MTHVQPTAYDLLSLDLLTSHFPLLSYDVLTDDDDTPYVAIDGIPGMIVQITRAGAGDWRLVAYDGETTVLIWKAETVEDTINHAALGRLKRLCRGEPLEAA